MTSTSVYGSLKEDLSRMKFPNCAWIKVEEALGKGKYSGYHPPNDVYQVFEYLSKKFTDFVTPIEHLGNTDSKKDPNPIYLVGFTEKADEHEPDHSDKPGMLITAAHRGDEPMTVSQVLYTALHYIFNYYHKDPKVMHLFQKSVLWFIPVVNPDGYKFFLEKNKKGKQILPYRKNRFKHKDSPNCPQDYLVGVDLNRNYNINYTNENSSACSQDYAGARAFSEIETQAVENTLKMHKNIKLAVNFMGAHGLWRMPHRERHLQKGNDLYHQVKNLTHISLNETDWVLTGDVTDWMFWKGVTAFSGLVGVEGTNGEVDPFPPQYKALTMWRTTNQTLDHLFDLLPSNLDHDFTNWQDEAPRYLPESMENATKYRTTMIVQAFNKGLAPLHEVHVGIRLNHRTHLESQHEVPFHLFYSVIDEQTISDANDADVDYRIHGKYTTGELKKHNVTALSTHWNHTHHQEAENITLISNEGFDIPGRHFLRVWCLVHLEVARNVHFDVIITQPATMKDTILLDSVVYKLTPIIIHHDGLGGGSIFLVVMAIFLLMFVPLCVCYIYMKKTQEEREQMGDYMMHKGEVELGAQF